MTIADSRLAAARGASGGRTTAEETAAESATGPAGSTATGSTAGAGEQPRRRSWLRPLPEFEPPLDPHPWPAPAVPSPAPPAPPTPPAPAPATPPEPRASTAEEAAARQTAVLVLRLLMEVLDGRRPASQLQPMLGQRAYQRASAVRATLRAGRVHSTARLRSVHICHPLSGAAEVSATWELGGRVRALAARFECGRGTRCWRCTVLVIRL